jgi:hypothetical protein
MKMKTLLAALSVFLVAIAALADEHAMAVDPSVQQLRREWCDIAGDITQAVNEAAERDMHTHAVKPLTRAQERINAPKKGVALYLSAGCCGPGQEDRRCFDGPIPRRDATGPA